MQGRLCAKTLTLGKISTAEQKATAVLDRVRSDNSNWKRPYATTIIAGPASVVAMATHLASALISARQSFVATYHAFLCQVVRMTFS